MTITERFKERLASKSADSAREVEFEGFPLRLRLAPLEIWLANGRIPQSLASKLAGASMGESEFDASEISVSDGLDALAFAREVVEYAAVEPRIVYGTPKDANEVSAMEIDAAAPGLLAFVFQYATRQIGSAPIETANGEVSAASLNTFPDEAGTD